MDISRDAPNSGSYDGVSPMGLIWSQAPEIPGRRDQFNPDVLQPLLTEVHASSGAAQASATLTQRLAAEGVTRQEVRDDGLVGTLFLPRY